MNGLIEQWNVYENTAAQNFNYIITLPIAFSDINYIVNITGENAGSTTYVSRTGVRKITENTFDARCSGPTTTDKPSKINWHAKCD